MNRPPSLCPGYIHVDAFTAAEGDEDEWEEEEETYVTLDLENVEPSLIPSSESYRIMGLDTPTPYLQLSGTVLKGSHEWMLGSEILFDGEALEHVALSEQRVVFREVRLQDKKQDKATTTTTTFDPIPIDPALERSREVDAEADSDDDYDGEGKGAHAKGGRGKKRARGQGPGTGKGA